MTVRLGRLCGAASLAMLVVLMSAPAGLAQTSGNWQIEPVSTVNDVGEDLSLAIDSADQLHIAYFDTTNDDVLYSYYDGSVWVIEIVEHLDLPPSTFGTNIQGTSIALDNNNVPHIAYHDGASLKYASRVGDNHWDVESVDTSGDFVGITPSLAIGSLNQPFIAYRASDPIGNGDIRLAYAFNGTWHVQTVSGDGDRRSVALTLDGSDRPHIVYTDQLLNDLYYAAGENVSVTGDPVYEFTIERVVDDGDGSGAVSIEIVSFGDVHVAYYDGSLQYARRYAVSGAWTYETVDAGDRTGDFNSLELDSQNQPRISYYDFPTNEIKYASHSTADGWHTEVVDPLGEPLGGIPDGFTSLAFDSQDHPHIAYHDTNNGDLKHATRDFGGPPPPNSPPTVDAGGPYSGAEGSSITIDATAGDPDSDPLNNTWDYRIESADPGTTCNWSSDSQVDTTFSCTDDGTFTVSLHVSDNINAPVSDSATVTIGNANPAVTLGEDVEISEGETFTASGSFTDPGANDTHTATVDYGDGSGVQSLTLNTDKTFSLSNDYAATGEYQVTVCVTDDDSGNDCDDLQVTVNTNQAPTVDAGGPYSGTEGSPTTLDGTVSDPESSSLTTTWFYGYALGSADPGTTCTFGDSSQVDTTITCTDNGTFNLRLSADDGFNPAVDDFVTVTINNVVPTVTLGDDASLDEGETFSGTGSFSDPGANDTHTATVDYGDGSGSQPLTLNIDGSFGLSHTYLDDGQYTLEICVTDDDQGSACDTQLVTVQNVAPTITGISAVVSGTRVTVTVAASDPAGVNDPLSYAFDCNNDDDYEVGPQPENSAACAFGPHDGVFQINVQVDDGDGGTTTGSVNAIVASAMCSSNYTGLLRYTANCHSHETAVTIPGEEPVTVCASTYNGMLRLPSNGACAGHETSYVLPEDGPLSVCVNRYSQTMRVIDDIAQCTSTEFGRVIAATEVGELPPPRTR